MNITEVHPPPTAYTIELTSSEYADLCVTLRRCYCDALNGGVSHDSWIDRNIMRPILAKDPEGRT